MNAVSHEPFERKFKLHNVDFELVPEVQIDTMIRRESTQVRKHSPLAPRHQVERYALAMEAGQVFPPVVLWGDVVLDGNTRIAAAAKAGIATLPAYSVTCRNERQAVILAAALNQMNGRPLVDEESRDAAVLMMQDGMKDEYIAREVQVNATKVRRWRKEQEVRERAERFDVLPEVAALSANQQRKLEKITHEKPFVAAVRALAERQPSAPQFTDLVEKVLAAPSDEDAVEAVESAARDWEPVGKYPKGQAGAVTAKDANAPIGMLLKHDAAHYVDLTLAAEQLPRWEQLRRLVDDVIAEYRRLQQVAS